MFERLFKYPIEQLREGVVAVGGGSSLALFVAAVVGVVLILSVVYARAGGYRDGKTRAVSLGLRLLAGVLLCLPLLEPVLVSTDVVPDENFVAVVVDASASMAIPDGVNGQTRYDEALEVMAGGEGATASSVIDAQAGLVGELREHFNLRYYAVGDRVERVDSIAGSVSPDARSTALSQTLDRVLSDFRGVPLSGVVVLTDGGDNGGGDPTVSASAYAAAEVPLHIVGLGGERFAGEREILDVSVTKAVEQNTGAEIDVKVRSWSSEADPVDISIYRGTERVFTEPRMLKGDGKIDQFTVFFEPPIPGIADYRLELEPSENELNLRNNSLEVLIDTRSDVTRVLYFEGALRSEFKFIKRALEDDQVVDFVSVSRTGTGKYYRQGIAYPEELEGGFPASEEELYGFEAVIFGDIEASAFSIQQQRMIEKFVRVRGGGFLMLGGLSAFAEGDYWNTPIADILPVAIEPGRAKVIPDNFVDPGARATGYRRGMVVETADLNPAEQGFQFVPTAAGVDNPILKLSADPSASAALWRSVPRLTSINLLGRPKPGATVLAEKPSDRFGAAEPLLLTQRYGRGRGTALATASTWRWQMQTNSEDFRHERFWRQLVRWQAASAPEQVNLHTSIDTPEPGQEVEVTVELFDESYSPLTGLTVSAQVYDAAGNATALDVPENLLADGEYVASFVPQNEGIHRIEVVATGGRDGLGSLSASESILVRPSRTEFYDATQKRDLLQQMADVSAGAYHAPSEAGVIPERLRSRRTSSSIYRSDYLWDAPFWLLLAMLVLCAEWYYRRRKGLA